MTKIAMISKKIDKKTGKVSWKIELEGETYDAIYRGNKILPREAKELHKKRKPKSRKGTKVKNIEKE